MSEQLPKNDSLSTGLGIAFGFMACILPALAIFGLPSFARPYNNPELRSEIFLRALEGEDAEPLRQYLVEEAGLTFDEADVVLLRVERQLFHLQHPDIYLNDFND